MESDDAVYDTTNNTTYNNNVDHKRDKSVNEIDSGKFNSPSKCSPEYIDYTYLLNIHKNLLDRYSVNNHETVGSDVVRTTQCSDSKSTSIDLRANDDCHRSVYNKVVEESRSYGKQLDEAEEETGTIFNHVTISGGKLVNGSTWSHLKQRDVNKSVDKNTTINSIQFDYNKQLNLDVVRPKTQLHVSQEENVSKSVINPANLTMDDTLLNTTENLAMNSLHLQLSSDDEDMCSGSNAMQCVYSNRAKTKHKLQSDEILQINEDLSLLNASKDLESEEKTLRFLSLDKRKIDSSARETELGRIKKMKLKNIVDEIALFEKEMETKNYSVSKIGNLKKEKEPRISKKTSFFGGEIKLNHQEWWSSENAINPLTTFKNTIESREHCKTKYTERNKTVTDQPETSFSRTTETVNGHNHSETLPPTFINLADVISLDGQVKSSKNEIDSSITSTSSATPWDICSSTKHAEAKVSDSATTNNTELSWSFNDLKTNKNMIDQSTTFDNSRQSWSFSGLTKNSKTVTAKNIIDHSSPSNKSVPVTNKVVSEDRSTKLNKWIKSFSLSNINKNKYTKTKTNKVTIGQSTSKESWGFADASKHTGATDPPIALENAKITWIFNDSTEPTEIKKSKNSMDQSAIFKSSNISWNFRDVSNQAKTNTDLKERPIIKNTKKSRSPRKLTGIKTGKAVKDQSTIFNHKKTLILSDPPKHIEANNEIQPLTAFNKTKILILSDPPKHPICKDVIDPSTVKNADKLWIRNDQTEINKDEFGHITNLNTAEISEIISDPTKLIGTETNKDVDNLDTTVKCPEIAKRDDGDTEVQSNPAVLTESSIFNNMDKSVDLSNANKDEIDQVTRFTNIESNASQVETTSPVKAHSSSILNNGHPQDIAEQSSTFISTVGSSTIRINSESEDSECLVSSSGIVEPENEEYSESESSDESVDQEVLKVISAKEFEEEDSRDANKQIQKEKVKSIIEKCSKIADLTPCNILDYLTADEIRILGGEVLEIPETGFDKGYEAEEILGASSTKGKLLFLMKWKDVDETEVVPANVANQQCPHVVIKFYEQHLQFKKHTIVNPIKEKNDNNTTGNTSKDNQNTENDKKENDE